MKISVSLIVSLLFFAVSTTVNAHPHIWIENQVEVRVNGNRIEAVRVEWTFDPFFSQSVLVDIGQPQGGGLSSSQVEQIRLNAFENLRNFGYFTYIRINGKEHPVRRVERFNARVNDDITLVYSFEIPIDVPLGTEPIALRVSMYDESFFTDFAYKTREARVDGASDIQYSQSYDRSQHTVPIWGPMQRETIEVVFRPE